MKEKIIALKEKIIQEKYEITKEEALNIYKNEPTEILCQCALEITKNECSVKAELCSVINAKQGKCSENCKYCAQSAHWKTSCTPKQVITPEETLTSIKKAVENHIDRISLVTAGRSLSGKEFETILECYKKINEKFCGKIDLCASLGILSKEQLKLLKENGVTRYHHNIETSRNYFPFICTTHTYDERIKTIMAAKEIGLEICSGGIIGMGESYKDRIDFAFEIKNLKVQSVPVNILMPIKGTPFENLQVLSNEEILRTFAVFRFIMPSQVIRCAAGRKNLGNNGEKAFLSGANALISGDFLTTSGSTSEEDINMLKKLGLY